MTKYASIVPLIGGETLAMDRVFEGTPDYILSYSGFEANDSQLVSHYRGSVPYYKLDEGATAPRRSQLSSFLRPGIFWEAGSGRGPPSFKLMYTVTRDYSYVISLFYSWQAVSDQTDQHASAASAA